MASHNIEAIDDGNFDQAVLQSAKPFLLDVSAVWCGPCKALLPVVESLADENVGRFRVGKIDIDDSPRAARRLGVRGAPTIVVFKNGRETARHVGTCNKATLISLLER